MILIGQYDSPFVRRVGIALTLYGLPFEHRPWSVFGDMEKIQPFNPLIRVPTLVLDNGEVLIESHSILDYLDSLMPAELRLFPVAELARHQSALKIAGLFATGLGVRRQPILRKAAASGDIGGLGRNPLPAMQIAGKAAVFLEADRAAERAITGSMLAHRHADIAVAAVLRSAKHRGLVAMADFPALGAHAAKLEGLPVFQAISQPFIAPA
ncbi:MAG: glutathione S-transferase family protein [Gammaproteobacteria bacterium]